MAATMDAVGQGASILGSIFGGIAGQNEIQWAKGLLMQLRNLNEADAYNAMRKMAMDRNIRIAEVADKLLAMNDLLT